MKYLFYLLVICLLSIGCNTDENRSKQRLQEIETLKAKIQEFDDINDYVSAIKICSQIIELDSTNAEHYDKRKELHIASYWWGRDTSNKESLELAYTDLTKAILLEPTSIRYLSRASIAAKLFTDNKLVLDDYNHAVEIAEQNEKFNPLLARARFSFYTQKDSLSAFQDIERALNLNVDPDLKFELRFSYCVMLMDCKKFERAEKEILEAQVTPQKDGTSHDKLYEALTYCKIEQGNYSGALITLETTNLPADFKNHHKGFCLYKTGKVQEGKKLLLAQKEISTGGLPVPREGGSGKKGGLPKKDRGKFKTSKYFLEVFPEYKSDSTLVVTPTWDWPNQNYTEQSRGRGNL